jgi:lysophospholipase L1-like esterase
MESGSFAKLGALIHGVPKHPGDCNIILVALGDSVTQGLALNPKMLGEEVYHALLRRELHRQFPERSFSTINAGVGGDTTEGALARLEHDVLRHDPHLVTVCFGLNDSGKGRRGLPRFRENLTQIVDRIRQAGAAVVLMTPNMMALHDNERVDPNFRQALAGFIRCQTSGLLDRYVEEVRGVAAATGAPLADVYAEWKRRQAQGEDMTAHLANGLNHPDAFGHQIAAELLLQVILRQLAHTVPESDEAKSARGS